MTAESFINLAIPFLKLTDNVRTALELYNQNKLTFLPVLDGKTYLGMVSENQLLDETPSKKLSAFPLQKGEAFAHESIHFYEVLRLFNIHETNILAILNDENEYVGSILAEEITTYISKLTYINSPGGILVLTMNHNKYLLSEITRIVESNDMNILSLFVSENIENMFEYHVTIKLNRTDLTRLIASFERFEYNITASFHESVFQNNDVERLELLFKYLNI